jgi:hypothetical protein
MDTPFTIHDHAQTTGSGQPLFQDSGGTYTRDSYGNKEYQS